MMGLVLQSDFFKDPQTGLIRLKPKDADDKVQNNHQLLWIRRDCESSGTNSSSSLEYLHVHSYAAVTEQEAFDVVLPRQDDMKYLTGNGLKQTIKHSCDGDCPDPTVLTVNSHQQPCGYYGSRASYDEEMEILCSFGGTISRRPCDGKLKYVGGQTQIVSLKKNLNFSDLQKKTSAICNQIHKIKYQLPGEDLDVLVSVYSQEDVQHMIEEYDDDSKGGSERLQIFLIPAPTRPHSLAARTAYDGSVTRKMKFMCSFGGKILPRPCDGKLRYVGGETHLVSLTKNNLTFRDLEKKTSAICNHLFKIKYQLPGEDLDPLISVCSEDEFQHMIQVYDDDDSKTGSERMLRMFLVDPTEESDKPYSLAGRSAQKIDACFQYVAAVNGILEHIHRRSSSGAAGHYDLL